MNIFTQDFVNALSIPSSRDRKKLQDMINAEIQQRIIDENITFPFGTSTLEVKITAFSSNNKKLGVSFELSVFDSNNKKLMNKAMICTLPELQARNFKGDNGTTNVKIPLESISSENIGYQNKNFAIIDLFESFSEKISITETAPTEEEIKKQEEKQKRIERDVAIKERWSADYNSKLS